MLYMPTRDVMRSNSSKFHKNSAKTAADDIDLMIIEIRYFFMITLFLFSNILNEPFLIHGI